MKTTKRHFEIFKRECEKWIKIFGLVDWEVWYEHKKLKHENWLAQHASNVVGRNIWYALNTEWDQAVPLTEHEIKASAFHEVFESRMANLRAIAKERSLNDDELDEEIHAIVKLIQNVLWLPTVKK